MRFVNASTPVPAPVIEVAAAGVGVLKVGPKPAVATSGVAAVESCTQLPANVWSKAPIVNAAVLVSVNVPLTTIEPPAVLIAAPPVALSVRLL